MSNFSRHIAATDGTACNKQHDPGPTTFFSLRGATSGKPGKGVAAFCPGKFAHLALQCAALLLIIVIAMIAMVKPAHAAEPPTVAPYPGVLTYYGTDNGYLCYAKGLPTGTDEMSVALATANMYHYSTVGYATRGSGIYDGKRYSAYQDSIWAYPYRPTIAVAQYVCPDGTNNPSSPAYNCSGMPNARNNPNECCPCGYRFDPAQGMCLLMSPKPAGCPSFCPAHAHGTPPSCVCDEGYKFDSAGTSCVLEQYTIALSGLGGEVMPTRTRAAYAQVTKSDGAPKSGAQVTLILTVVPENGDPVRAEHVGGISPNGGATDADGRLSFVFTAPVAGGLHTITATCTNCTNQAEGTIKVPGCPIPPLSAPPFTDPVAQGFENGNRWRPDLLTADYQTKLACVEAAITASGGTSTGTSAYRPTQYQQHFYEIVQKDKDLFPGYMVRHPECQALRDKVTAEMGGHGLKPNQLVAEPGTSRHESGTAFDITPSNLTETQLTEVYTGCGVTHTAVPSEPWHVQ